MGWDNIKPEFWGGIEIIPPIKVNAEPKENRQFYSFSKVDKMLKTNGVEYYCLYRNRGMNLEKLKERIDNIYIFVTPLSEYFIKNGIKNLCVAPPGSRSEANGFHFATELLKAVKKISDIKIVSPFVNIKNKITLMDKIDGNFYLFDDIITRGTTLKKMDKYVKNKGAIILLTNH